MVALRRAVVWDTETSFTFGQSVAAKCQFPPFQRLLSHTGWGQLTAGSVVCFCIVKMHKSFIQSVNVYTIIPGHCVKNSCVLYSENEINLSDQKMIPAKIWDKESALLRFSSDETRAARGGICLCQAIIIERYVHVIDCLTLSHFIVIKTPKHTCSLPTPILHAKDTQATMV